MAEPTAPLAQLMCGGEWGEGGQNLDCSLRDLLFDTQFIAQVRAAAAFESRALKHRNHASWACRAMSCICMRLPSACILAPSVTRRVLLIGSA